MKYLGIAIDYDNVAFLKKQVLQFPPDSTDAPIHIPNL